MANLSEFGASLETTKEWLSELMATLQMDEAKACRAFRAVTHELRDRLTVEEIADLSAQLPLLLRGVFFEGWRPSGKSKQRSKEDFLENVAEFFPEAPHIGQVEKIVREVFMFIDRRVSSGEVRHVVNSLPKDLRSLWPQYSGERYSA